ncbi:MAG: S9 family peptidase [Acidobacteria bacterium]|nr:S9 family peptidase [Acidobacteriota bacterium]
MTAACGGGGATESGPAPTVAPYGTWASPLTAARATAGALRFGQIAIDGDDLYWLEGRASEGGKNVLVRSSPGAPPVDVSPRDFNVRSRVHEYGGAAYAVHKGTIYASNFADQKLYAFAAGRTPTALTLEGYFYAQCRVDTTRSRLLCVREDHTSGDEQPPASIVAIPLGTSAPTSGVVMVSGADFYSDPIVSPDGARLAWLQWSHPNMPWDGTSLYVAELDARGLPGAPVLVAGGAEESVFQPSWSPDGVLYFVSDRSGWWNLYRQQGSVIEPIHAMQADFGKPQWSFGMTTYAFQSANRIVATWTENGRWRLGLLSLAPRRMEPLELTLDPLESLVATSRAAYFVGGSPTEGPAITRVSFGGVEAEILKRSRQDTLEGAYVSAPETVTFDSGGQQTHAFYYPPTNPAFAAPAGTSPPLLVLSHGGPTGATDPVFDPEVQFWTTRGFAVVDVNYSGSTGYGRAYRRRLNGQWGIVDVADAVNAANYLVAAGKADPARLITRGGSAGGYTTLAALTFHDTFKAGASYYGISDLEVLATDTHKFESRYMDSLVGRYPATQATYRERSPIHFVDRLNCALILLQGLDDKVVPPRQSEMMADAVRKKGLPVAYVTFEGEQHGFRKAENIVRALESELYFYGKVFGFTPADTLTPVPIDNLR